MSLIDLIYQNEPELSLTDFDEDQVLVMPDTDVDGGRFAVWVYTVDGDLMDVDDFAELYDLEGRSIGWVVLSPPMFIGTYYEWVCSIKDWVNHF